jgi:hypothetical protein
MARWCDAPIVTAGPAHSDSVGGDFYAVRKYF